MAALQLNRYETEMAIRAEAAELCDFTGPEWRNENRVELRAEAIRAILLGLPVKYFGSDEEKTVDLRGTGVGMKRQDSEPSLNVLQAYVTGWLDLDHAARPDGSPLPYLSLMACVFEKPISLRHARIRGLDLTGSQVSHISAQYAAIDGSVDLSGLRALEAADAPKGLDARPQCWVDFHGAKISKSFNASGAVLIAPEKRPKEEAIIESRRYAMDLNHAQIGGSLVLRHSFFALGGMNINLARIEGHLRAEGCNLQAGEGKALTGKDVEIRGGVYLWPWEVIGGDTVVTQLKGGVDLARARITGNLSLGGAQVEGSLFAEGAIFGGSVFMRAWDQRKAGSDEIIVFHVAGTVSLERAVITGQLDMCGAKIDGDLNIQTVTTGANVLLSYWSGKKAGIHKAHRFSVNGGMRLSGAKIVGSLVLDSALVGGNLIAQDLEVSRNTFLRGRVLQDTGKSTVFPFSIHGVVDLSGARIGQDLDLRRSNLNGGFSAKNAEVGGNTYFPFWRFQMRLSYGRLAERLSASSKPLALLLLFWVIGGLGVGWVNQPHSDIGFDAPSLPFLEQQPWPSHISIFSATPIMVIDSGTVSTLSDSELGKLPIGPAHGEFLCGNHIEPAVYAFDLLIPLLDLHQEHRCAVTSAPRAVIWRWLGAGYIFAGWILVSWLILNLTGLMQSGPGPGGRRS